MSHVQCASARVGGCIAGGRNTVISFVKGLSTCDDATRVTGEVKAFTVVVDAVRDIKLSAKL